MSNQNFDPMPNPTQPHRPARAQFHAPAAGRSTRIPVSAIGRTDLTWFVVTYQPEAPLHLPQSVAASYVVCESDADGRTNLAVYLEWPDTEPQCVARMPHAVVDRVSMHPNSLEAAHAADLAWAEEVWGVTPWTTATTGEGLFVPTDL